MDPGSPFISRLPGRTRARLAPDLARLPIVRNPRGFSLAEGVRAALSVSVLIAAGEYFDQPLLRESAIAALWTCLCDTGGPVRRRVPPLLSFTLLGALLTACFGLVRGLGPFIALPTGVLALFVVTMARVHGQAALQVGTMLSLTIVLSLDRPLSPAEALQMGAAFAFGSLWAALLTLVIWRLYPYRATRQAVAEVYDRLAVLCRDLLALLGDENASDAEWEVHARTQRRAVRDAIEAARGSVMAMLRGRGPGGLRASQSLIRLETADQLFGALIALSDVLEHGADAERATGRRMVRRLRPLLTLLARVAASDAAEPPPRISASIDAMAADAAGLAAGDPLHAIADRLIECLRIAQTLAAPANIVPGKDPDGRRLPWTEHVLRPWRANLNWQSPSLRHALRLALTAAPALAFTMTWFSEYDHWLTITIVATLQPFFTMTYAKALERVGGTALGGVVAAGVGLVCTTPLSVALATFPLMMAAQTVRAINFGLYIMAVTPVIVLLVETGEPDTAEWRIALARATFTIIGGLTAVAASFLLWPGRKPEQLMASARDAIAAHGRYAEAEMGALLREVPLAEVERARRQAGLASNELEASINRALIEQGGGARDMLETVLVIDAALRRIAGRLTVMQLHSGPQTAMPAASLSAWRDWIGGAMRSLATGDTELSPRPDASAGDAPQRIARQVELMAGAMKRVLG